MAKQFEVIVTVRPLPASGTFPVDMLRYDGLYPARETDSYRLQTAIQGHHDSRDDWADGKGVMLKRYADKEWKPNADRWRSFGWEVAEVRFTGHSH
jgi:hypothetical protein